jgi:NAD(P)-dependent dehydrogenase (short-subunit alcohol dehydrogenase family)
VTGATSGIGLALVEQLLGREASVIGVARAPDRCATQLDRLGGEYRGARLAYIQADLANRAEVGEATRGIERTLNTWHVEALDGLINNAGTSVLFGMLAPGFFKSADNYQPKDEERYRSLAQHYTELFNALLDG